MSTPSTEQMGAHSEFARLAGQYYAAGRFAALSQVFPVAGNLLHHAIEMFLKCVLVKTLTLRELKKMGHNLTALWNRFAQIHPDLADASLSTTLAELQKFERLRYPDSVLAEGMQGLFAISRAGFSPLPDGPLPTYHLVLEDVDAIAQVTAQASGLKPIAFTLGLSPQAIQFLELENLHPLQNRASG
jgi:hypothetical protein